MVAASPDQIIAETKIPTTTPEETIKRTNDFFSPFVLKGELAAVGIGSFGPVDLNQNSPNLWIYYNNSQTELELYGFIGRHKKKITNSGCI